MSTLLILWDESHLWGLLAVRAAQALGIAHTVSMASDIPAQLQKNTPAMLLVPGGNARQKAARLGPAGMESIRHYVKNGGHYLGFCGGAGLALSWQGGLELCPCGRGKFDDRMQHFMSGHLHVSLPKRPTALQQRLYPQASQSAEPLLPVWWPGRFDGEETEGMSVLARYAQPGSDFWLADLPIADIPSDMFAIWRDVYGFSLNPAFLHGQPCIVHGAYGTGSYTLSYSHLETPASPFANAWFSHLLASLGGIPHTRNELPEWNISATPDMWQDKELHLVGEMLENIVNTGLKHSLLFPRTPWLLGWRTGIPGMHLNNLRTLLCSAQETPPSPEAARYWQEKKAETVKATALFHEGCIQYLLAERLSQTLAKQLPDVMSAKMLVKQREALFGKPMHPEGFYQNILQVLDRLSFLQACPPASLAYSS